MTVPPPMPNSPASTPVTAPPAASQMPRSSKSPISPNAALAALGHRPPFIERHPRFPSPQRESLMAGSQPSAGPATTISVRRVDDHPAHAEAVGHHAEAVGQERLAQRHLHLPAIAERREQPLG